MRYILIGTGYIFEDCIFRKSVYNWLLNGSSGTRTVNYSLYKGRQRHHIAIL